MVKAEDSRSEAAQSRSKNEGVRSLDRALSILEAISQRADGISLSVLALDLDLPLSTVHRLLTTLESRSFVYLDKRRMVWRIGRMAATIGANFAGSRDLVSLAKPIMENAAIQFSEVISLGIISEGKVIFIHRIDPRGRRGFMPKIPPLPPYCTSIGKAVLSASPQTEVSAAIASGPLRPLTRNTITSAVALLDDLSQARRSGFAIDNEENTVGLRCLAAPVFDELQRPIAAVSVSQAVAKSQNARRGVTGEMIRSVASDITRAYGGLELKAWPRSA